MVNSYILVWLLSLCLGVAGVLGFQKDAKWADSYCDLLQQSLAPAGASFSNSQEYHRRNVKNNRYLAMLRSVNNTATSFFEDFMHAAAPYTASTETRKEGPSLAITIISRVTPHIHSYAAYSSFLQLAYAMKNGYILKPFVPDSTANDFEYHRKLIPLLETLDDRRTISSDYVVWMDADCVVLDMHMRIEAIAARCVIIFGLYMAIILYH